ncbi:IclR family transcriptional regulator domain-containing protein [Cohaesibacter celericrescens]|uniref:IclR family transcriptional regulator n=1 Tax=Cohaesibacter celericrescens TaxID=2067669 RepID=A0A2N5XPZ4_9HYPH|nr:IclR family transcriptional regulator C-terminal domain-containing protein [Cohaesibacter celericrescens]PLW76582.1 IclR family transcriptional regulator [Cohaesibacter celericrescens]
MANKPTDFVTSLAKGLQVIEAFGADSPRLCITEVAHRTGLDRATVRRCLLTLHTLGYTDYDGKYFTLALRSLRLGLAGLASMPLPNIVQPWLDKLSDRIGQSCSVSILDGHDIVYVARAAQRRIMSIGLMPGSHLPAHCTSMGRVLLAALPEAEARTIIEESDLVPHTPFSLTDPDLIMDEVARVREQGYAVVDQETELGLRSIGVALIGHRGQVQAALNVAVAAVQPQASDLVEIYLDELHRVQSGLARVLP